MAISIVDSQEVNDAFGDPNSPTLVPLDNSTGDAVLLFATWYESVPTVDGFAIGGMTFFGTPLVKIGYQITAGVRCEVWGLEVAAAGADNIEITWTGDTTLGQYTAEFVSVAVNKAASTQVSFSNVTAAAGTSSAPAVSVLKDGDSGLVLAIGGTLGTSAFTTAETALFESSISLLNWSIVEETSPAAPGTKTMNWTLSSSDDWNVIGLEVQENAVVTLVSLPVLGTG